MTVNGASYRRSLVEYRGVRMIGVTKAVREAAGARIGDRVDIVLELDAEERTVEVPADLADALALDEVAAAGWERFSYTHQREYVTAILKAKKAEMLPEPNLDEQRQNLDEEQRRQRTHTAVSEAYTRAVNAASSCCGGAEPKGVAAKLAGYSPEEMAALPSDALANSFGCGNPLAFSDVEPGEVVLDLGSGAGIDLLLAAAKVGPTGRVIGVDMTDVMIERARANAAAAGFDTIEVRMGIIEELPVETASVDLVISNCVINLSPDKERVFPEITRVLKPGGRLRVSDIVARELPQWARESAQLYSSCIAGAISEEEYLAGLRAAGLEDVQVVERLVYDTMQLEALISSEIVEGAEVGCCGSPADSVGSGERAADTGGTAPGSEFAQLLGRAAAELQGEVWSAIFLARKPG